MTSIRLNPFVRGTTWLLVAAFLLASLPGGAFAQDVPAVDARARERIAQFRAARAGQPPAPAADGEAPAFSAQSSEGGESSLETSTTTEGETLYQLKLSNASLDVLLDEYYAPLTGRTMIKAPGVAGTFNFKAREKLTKAEMIQAMDSLLSMNNLALVPLGERFFRVVQIDKAPTEGLAIQRDGLPAGPDSDALVSQLIPLKYLEMEDANTIVQSMLHGFGKVQRFDRISSLLVTETATNLRRIHEILELVDQPTELKVETRVYEIKHAKASEIAARLNELVSDSQGEKKEEVAQVAQPATTVRRPAGMIRARPAAAPEPAPSADTAAALEAAMAEKGILSGKVKVLADERTNIIIVISRPSNFTFFDKIVAVLDRPVDPEVVVQVVALEFADAEEMAGLLNDFIGAAKAESETAAPAAGAEAGGTDGRARALEDFVRARAAAADRVRQAAGEEAASKIGQLSANTKILADKRTNTLLLMGTKGDIAALQDVVKKVDIMLAQVLIEAVILEVNLNNNVAYGVNWLQKSMTAYSQRSAGANGGVSLREPVASWGGAFGNQNFGAAAGDTITRASASALNSGLSYFFTFADLNIDMVLDMVASSGEGRVLATPVILTTDNTEAEIMSGQQIPIRTGDTTSGGTIQSDYEYKDVGIQLKVKPRINPSRYVTLEITQSADTLGDPVDVGNNGKMYAINKREMTASISVPSRATIVLGGLVQTDYQNLNTRVPILGSIPVLGSLFRSEDTTRKRTELLVLITPYVLMTPGEAREETERLHRASNVAAEDWYRGWSDSSLAPFSPQKLRELELSERRAEKEAQRARVQVPNAPDSAPPVALIAPAAAAAEPAAPAPAAPLPAPEEPTPTAPFAFDPAVPAEPAEPPPPAAEKPAKKPRRKAKAAETKPSMFAAPEAAPAPAATGETP
jgi:general secretion pathway protein D